jgi:hypothetical protein
MLRKENPETARISRLPAGSRDPRFGGKAQIKKMRGRQGSECFFDDTA